MESPGKFLTWRVRWVRMEGAGGNFFVTSREPHFEPYIFVRI